MAYLDPLYQRAAFVLVVVAQLVLYPGASLVWREQVGVGLADRLEELAVGLAQVVAKDHERARVFSAGAATRDAHHVIIRDAHL